MQRSLCVISVKCRIMDIQARLLLYMQVLLPRCTHTHTPGAAVTKDPRASGVSNECQVASVSARSTTSYWKVASPTVSNASR